MNIEILENGNLKLVLESDDLEYFDYETKQGDYNKLQSLIYDLFEPYSCNGSYALFDAGDANPFVGLTDAPCIAESMDYLDDGTKEIIGNCWYYSEYMINDFVSKLIENGEVIFTLARE